MGQYIEAFGVTAVWSLVFFISLLGAAALLFLYRLERRSEKKKEV